MNIPVFYLAIIMFAELCYSIKIINQTIIYLNYYA